MIGEIFKKEKISKEIYKKYWKLAWPAAIEGVFINIILLVDLIMVGKLGVQAAAAVGVISQPKMIMQMFGKAVGVGVVAITSRRKGEKDKEGINRCVKEAFIINLLIYIILLFLAYTNAEKIIKFSGAKEDYLNLAVIYFKYIAVALFIKASYLVFSSAQIGVGNTKIVLLANVLGNIVNAVLNYIFIFGKLGFTKMGIKGAGLSTVIGNLVIFLVLLYSVTRPNGEINILRKNKKINKDNIKPLISISSNSFLEQIFNRIGLFIFARLVAELGTVAMATHHYCIIIWDLYYYFGIGLGVASSSFAGQKLGEGRKDLVKEYIKAGSNLGLLISTIVCIIMIVIRKPLLIIIAKDIRVVELGSTILIIVGLCSIFQTEAQIYSGALRGVGDNRYIAIYSFFVSAIIKPLIAYIFAYKLNFSLSGMWIALILDEIFKMILSKRRFETEKWSKSII